MFILFNRNGFSLYRSRKVEKLNRFFIYYTFMCVDFSQDCGCEMIGHERIAFIKVNAIPF